MAERGRIYRWPRNRPFGDSKSRPVLVVAPDAATRMSRRWVVVPLSSDKRLEAQPLAVRLEAGTDTGLKSTSYAMAWLPTTVDSSQLAGPQGRVSAEVMRTVLQRIDMALDLAMAEPWD